jgi:IQ domain-containing protein H
MLYYSSKTLRKIKSIVKDHYAYIVPSTPSNDYIHLCNELNVPLYGSAPQKLAYLSTKAGCKHFQEQLGTLNDESMGVLPYSIDIYSQSSLLNELTNLIYRYPYVKRWLLKVDNESQSRGIAYIDVAKIFGKFLTKLAEESTKVQEKVARE